MRNHEDPNLVEFTYGDSDTRARKLKEHFREGDFLFFHTTIRGRKCITAYFAMDRVLDTTVAANDRPIKDKYKNPHLSKTRDELVGKDDAILFGDPITSRKLDRPLPFDKALVSQLSLAIKFPPGRKDSQTIGSATRSWRQLTDNDADVLIKSIKMEDENARPAVLKTTEEVSETLERDVEDYLAKNPSLIADGLKLLGQQLEVKSGRIDLLFGTMCGNLVVVEVKLGRIGREAMRQVQDYVSDIKATERPKKVEGVLVCAGVMPAFESELRKQSKVRILIHGWRIEVQPW
jgi:Holliday junction resolvase-like predicted endonuclease